MGSVRIAGSPQELEGDIVQAVETGADPVDAALQPCDLVRVRPQVEGRCIVPDCPLVESVEMASEFGLNLLLVALALFETERVFRDAGGRPWRAWLWFGLGLANYTVTVVLLPVVAWAAIRGCPSWSRRLAAAL
jgi:hypothetical protein